MDLKLRVSTWNAAHERVNIFSRNFVARTLSVLSAGTPFATSGLSQLLFSTSSFYIVFDWHHHFGIIKSALFKDIWIRVKTRRILSFKKSCATQEISIYSELPGRMITFQWYSLFNVFTGTERLFILSGIFMWFRFV